jgi:hypothetical protein
MSQGEKITDLETVPAYKRQQIKIEEESAFDVEISHLKMEERGGKQHLSPANSYIHQRQD